MHSLLPGGTGFEPVRKDRNAKGRFTTEPAESAEMKTSGKARRHSGTKARNEANEPERRRRTYFASGQLAPDRQCWTSLRNPAVIQLERMRIPESSNSLPPPPITFAAFLEAAPPGRAQVVDSILQGTMHNSLRLTWPTVALWCNSDACKAVLRCDPTLIKSDFTSKWDLQQFSAASYACRNCKSTLLTPANISDA